MQPHVFFKWNVYTPMKIVNIWARGWWFQFLSPFSSPQIDGCIFVLGLRLVVNDFERLHRFWWPSRIGSVGHSHGVGAQHGDGHLSRSTNQWSGLPLHGDLLSCWSWVLGCGCHWLFSLVGAYSKHKMTRLLSISSLKHSFGFIISNKTGQCNKLN